MGAALVSPCVSPPESITMPPPSGVNNIFALLDDDNENEDDGFTVVAKPVKPPAKAAKAKEEEPKREVRKQKTDRPARGKGDKRREDRPYDGSDKPEKPAQEEGRKGGKGERREGGKGERKRGKGGRREFDRHSGTGRGKGSAREGRGSYNWGDKTDGAPEGAPEGTPASDGENKAPPPVEEEEEEENTMTLEEYMKVQANKAPVGKILTARKVDEGPMEGYLLTRDDEDVGHDDAMYGMAFHDYDGKKKEHEEKEAREGWVDADNVFNLKFVDPNAGGKGDRQGKGGKKGGRNDRNRDNGRGQKGQRPQGKLELSDVNAFPTLA